MTKKAKVETFPKHMQGNRCGYTLLENGSIKVAPLYQDRFKDLDAARRGVDAMLRCVSAYAAEVHAGIQKSQRTWFKDVGEDYGFNPGDGYEFDSETGIISKMKPKEAT